MYTMAKTIMISNDAYEKLKSIKIREDKSFSEVVVELVEEKKIEAKPESIARETGGPEKNPTRAADPRL